MNEKILIAVAWPYANGSLHLGQIAGAYLTPDIFARYHRALGNDVLMVSGSDAHGTPVTLRAEQEGISPGDVLARFQPEFLKSWEDLGIGFDIFTSTHTENHFECAQEIFRGLMRNGHVYEAEVELWYCPSDRRFLPDRYVEGTCPFCGYDGARGDQCDNCGRTLDASQLLEPRCRLDGTTPELRPTRHLFFRMSSFNGPLAEWLKSCEGLMRRPVLSWSLGITEEGMPDRAITRDIEWGVPVPTEGYEDKRIYVWVEALIGYFSAAVEWAKKRGEPERWREWWHNPDSRHYYFVGKDNIPFHTLIWPAMLMGCGEIYGGELRLPYDVPANQYVNFKGAKASTSRGTAPFLPEYLKVYDPDALRYYLSANMPELQDSSFDDADLIRRNNDELVATWGNLVNRVLAFTVRNFDGVVPEPGELDETSREVLEAARATVGDVGDQISLCRFRSGLQAAFATARRLNQYLDEAAPWKALKTDRQDAARSLWVAIQAINALKTALYPYLPFTSQRLHEYLGFDGLLGDSGWSAEGVPVGQKLAAPQPLFKKLDAAEILVSAD
ncbi:MAG: methionine--tRNA ligase [Dehalococcoidia bacterium]|nr:methionine--tRNA ligase [Dehalococcoidia bacterium]